MSSRGLGAAHGSLPGIGVRMVWLTAVFQVQYMQALAEAFCCQRCSFRISGQSNSHGPFSLEKADILCYQSYSTTMLTRTITYVTHPMGNRAHINMYIHVYHCPALWGSLYSASTHNGGLSCFDGPRWIISATYSEYYTRHELCCLGLLNKKDRPKTRQAGTFPVQILGMIRATL